MKHLILLILASALPLQAIAMESQGEFWLLRTDHKTAKALTTAISGKKLEPKALGERISGLIKQRKITELAKFEEKLGTDKVKMEKPEAGLKVKEIDETVPMGIDIEAEASFMENRKECYLRFAASISTQRERLSYDFKNVLCAITSVDNDWHLLHRWTNKKESTLLLARIHALPKRVKNEQLARECVSTDAELYLTTRSNLDKFKKSTPATRAKAIAWIKDRSKLLASTTLVTRSGEKAAHQDQLNQLYDKGGWNTAALGFLLETGTVLGRDKVDLSIDAEWQDPAKFSEKPEYKFSFTETVPTNQSLLIEPTTKPKGNTDALILILTPRAQAPTTPAPQDDSNKPVPDGISTRTYIVEPSFLRLLNEKHQADNALSTQGLLQKEGILFSEKAFANYIPATNTVILRNNKAAHLAFQKILKELASQ